MLTLHLLSNLWGSSTSHSLSSISHMAVKTPNLLIYFAFPQTSGSHHWTTVDFFFRVEIDLLIWATVTIVFSPFWYFVAFSCPRVMLLFHMASLWSKGPPCVLRNSLNSAKLQALSHPLWKVVQNMGWSVQWWEIELQSLVFDMGYTHRRVTAYDSKTKNNPDAFILQKVGDMNNDGIVTQ